MNSQQLAEHSGISLQSGEKFQGVRHHRVVSPTINDVRVLSWHLNPILVLKRADHRRDAIFAAVTEDAANVKMLAQCRQIYRGGGGPTTFRLNAVISSETGPRKPLRSFGTSCWATAVTISISSGDLPEDYSK